jgi:hypothetical protein
VGFIFSLEGDMGFDTPGCMSIMAAASTQSIWLILCGLDWELTG